MEFGQQYEISILQHENCRLACSACQTKTKSTLNYIAGEHPKLNPS